MTNKILPPLTKKQLGKNVPRRGGLLTPHLAKLLLKLMDWQVVGEIPNIQKAVVIGAPHTSNFDGLYAIPAWLAIDLDLRVLGKKQLFHIPILATFLRWAGVIPIDRSQKGSVLQASIDRFEQSEKLFLALSPEGTRQYTEQWKTGFYYLALGANVPILPVALDYQKKQIAFLPLFYPSGNLDTDLPKLYAYYQGVKAKYPQYLSKPLQDLNQSNNHE